MTYQPYTFAPTQFPQAMVYLTCQELNKVFFKDKFSRELIKLPDGGTMGLDWDGPVPDPSVNPEQPYLIMCPGLGGSSHNFYCLSLCWAARRAGFKVATLLFRGCEKIPITTGKLSYAGSWQDCEFALEYISKKYVRDPKTNNRRTRLYAYGVSLGAQILGLYLG